MKDPRFPTDLNKIIALLESHLWNVGNEVELQKAMSELFLQNHILHAREYVPEPRSRFDFYVPQEKGCIEVKITADFKKTIRQLHRYAQLDCVDFLIVVLTRKRGAGLYPDQISGKPLYKVQLRSAM